MRYKVENLSEYDEGYETYKQGHKMSAVTTTSFREGWWRAHDNRERFGDYDNFMVVPAEEQE